jgi:hypothetical protein
MAALWCGADASVLERIPAKFSQSKVHRFRTMASGLGYLQQHGQMGSHPEFAYSRHTIAAPAAVACEDEKCEWSSLALHIHVFSLLIASPSRSSCRRAPSLPTRLPFPSRRLLSPHSSCGPLPLCPLCHPPPLPALAVVPPSSPSPLLPLCPLHGNSSERQL